MKGARRQVLGLVAAGALAPLACFAQSPGFQSLRPRADPVIG